MHHRYTELDDLWCEWGEAVSAIMRHIEDNEPIENKFGWNFEEGLVKEHHREGYSVYIAHKAYDSEVSSIVRLHVQASVAEDGTIKVQTNKREKVETSDGF